MTSRATLAMLMLLASAARADEPPPSPSPSPPTAADEARSHLDRARELYARAQYARSRDELLAAYHIDPRPELLFALGQVEFNLAHYQQAITYYQRFLATNPAADQTALAQQAIGAARIELSKPAPPPAPSPVRLHRHFDTTDAGLTALGGLAALVGGGLLYDAYHLGNDHTGTLHTYDQRLSQARTTRLAGIACLGGGAVAIGAALVRWRFHLVETTIDVEPTTGGATISVGHSL